MNDPSVNVSLKFKVKPTSEGFLAQGITVPSIIIESSDKSELTQDLDAAIDCYFKSFPEELQKFSLKDEEEFKTVDKTI